MSVTPKTGKHGQGECDSQSPSPLAGSGPGGHKASFRSTKLARRARSFKEDFLEKISQMRSPAIGGMQGGVRPHSPKTRAIKNEGDHQDKSPTREINNMVRQVQIALIHFRDVVSKDKLEMLSGNGTIVLDTVLAILSALKPLISSDQSSTISSASNQVYQSLARLIKLCDDVLLNGNQSSALDQENVGEVVTFLEDAVKNLVKVAQEKIINRESTYKTAPRASFCNANLDMPAQRNSLPDIPLTPRERQILEQTSCVPGLVRSSHSSESILRENSPPPKPPLPDGICLSEAESSSLGTPPPLPPKKRAQRTQQLIGECCNSDSSLLACSLDRMSFRSKSPEDSSSLLSASAGSLDSVLNNSREEEEIRALMDHQLEESRRENDISDITCAHATNGNCTYDDSFCSTHNISAMNHISELQPLDTNRLSNTDSGFVSIHSHRNSVQSYNTSKRSSQQSSSSQWSSQQNSFKQLSTANSVQSTVQAETVNVHKSDSIIQNLSVVASEKVEASVSFTSATTTTFSQHSSLSSSQMSDLSVLHSIIDGSDHVDPYRLSEEGLPPAIPQKTRSRRGRQERQPSPYDNVPLENIGGELIPCSMHQSQGGNGVSSDAENARPPPLPVKKRHIMAYMEMFGNCSHSNDNEFLRHSVHIAQQHQQSQWQNQQSLDTAGLTTTQSCSFVQTSSTSTFSSQTIQHTSNLTIASMDHHNKLNLSTSPLRSPNSISPNNNGLPPALPPKRSRASSTKSSTSPPPPASPTNPPTSSINLTTSHNNKNNNNNTNLPSPNTLSSNHNSSTSKDLKLSPKPTRNESKSSESTAKPSITTSTPVAAHKQQKETKNDEQNANIFEKPANEGSKNNDVDLMEDLEVKKFITMKKQDEDGPDIRGGYIDALIVHATKPTKNDFSYQEAFLTTYRTFISPYDLITKLIRRHQYFICQPERKPRANEAFSLLVRVVNDLTISDLEDLLVQAIMNFIYQLVSSGNLAPAKPLRVTLVEKYNAKIFQTKISNPLSLSLAAGCATLLDFKSDQIAEQMTLLDANLFMKIEIPEVLIWAQEQNEERSPNLTRFTEHFNKMSYWARTKILQSEAKDREKYVMKFIKIMKHLRKINNFNSYLALLSALDSAPIRRLEWQKHITEGLKEYCALIDSSSSFRAYRQALAETSPPCIPYIGLVLQDLTFVHIGNSNLLQDGTINFSKRWQQFNIVENMKRFKKCSYTFKKNERIIAFFHNFDDYIVEDAMWQISESIKPRGGKKPIQGSAQNTYSANDYPDNMPTRQKFVSSSGIFVNRTHGQKTTGKIYATSAEICKHLAASRERYTSVIQHRIY